MGKHAILSASSAHRWMACTPSARLEQNFEDRAREAAAEGTEAHRLCEYKVKTALGLNANDPTEDLTYYNQEMEECANGYAAYILELVEEAKRTCSDPAVLIEQRLDFSRFVEGGFGTGDCVIIADRTLKIIDFKYGKGFLVEAEENPQMCLYGLGSLELFDGLYDIEQVALTVFQPRRGNFPTWITSKESLLEWAVEILKPTAELAYAGKGEFSAGDHCRFCRAKAECRARAELNMELARYDFKLPPLLEDDEVESILGKIDALISWASDIQDYALQAAVSGKRWEGWKLVEGRSNRKYTDETAVAETVSAAGYDPYERQVLSVTAMASLLGEKRFEEVLSGYIEKPQGKPSLVPESDKRPAIHTAQQDFNEF